MTGMDFIWRFGRGLVWHLASIGSLDCLSYL